MRCKEVKRGLVAYLDGEVMPSERTLFEAHLAKCAACEGEYSALSSARRQLTESLQCMAAEASPSAQALNHLRARLAAEAHTSKGERKMKLRWRIALGTAAAIVIAVAIIAVVPSTRAAAGDFFARVFNIDSSHPVKFGYLPEGFESRPLFVTASGSVEGQGGQIRTDEEALYRNGDLFLSARTSSRTDEPLPVGRSVKVNGHEAVLTTGLSGALGGPPPDAAKGLATGEPEVGVTAESGEAGPVTVVGGGSASSTSSHGSAPETFTYTNATSLVWDLDGTRVELLTNLPEEELLKIAEALTLPE